MIQTIGRDLFLPERLGDDARSIGWCTFLHTYQHGKINEAQVEAIEKSLNTIIAQFDKMKQDLLFLLKENEE